MKFIALLIIVVASIATQAQSIEYTRLVETHPSLADRGPLYPARDTYVFPLFLNPPGSAIGDSINADLARDFLDIELRDKKESIFENVWSTEETPIPQVSELTYEILHNKGRVLSIGLSGEGCGAYCEHFTLHYTYDLANGKRIHLPSLLTDRGGEELAGIILDKKAKILKNAIKETKRQLSLVRKKKREEGLEEYYTDQLELYEGCLESTLEETPSSFADYFDYNIFFVKGKTLTIIVGRCSAHVNRSVDELSDFVFSFSMKQLTPYLTSYGKEVLNVK